MAERADLSRELLDRHIGNKSTTRWDFQRVETQKPRGKPRLRADKNRGTITLDNQTTLTGITDSAWQYRLGSRSALEWVLHQHKERKPRDPTILQRFTTVSVETVRIVDQLAELSNIETTQKS